MTVHDFAWLCVTMCYFVLLHMTMYYFVWIFCVTRDDLYDPKKHFMPFYNYVWRY